jgi:MFS superfamily sulfate permease-like transporter
VLLLVLAVFFSGSVELLFRLFPSAVLGVILFLAGAQLALGAGSIGETRAARMVVLATAAFCMWNVAVGFLVGVALHHLQGRGLLRL